MVSTFLNSPVKNIHTTSPREQSRSNSNRMAQCFLAIGKQDNHQKCN